MWDTAFNLLSSSQADRNLVTAFVQLICTAVVNFTAGMVSSVFIFVFQLPWLLMSYQVRLSTPCVEVCFLRDVTLRLNCKALAALSRVTLLLHWCVLKSTVTLQASLPSMIAFFGLALLGCISVILSYLLGLYLAGATAIYATVLLTQTRRTLEGGRSQGSGTLSQRPHNE